MMEARCIQFTLSRWLALQAGANSQRHSSDLLDQDIRQQQLPDGQPMRIPSSGTAPKSAASKVSTGMSRLAAALQQQQAAGASGSNALIEEVELRGVPRTQQLLQRNRHLPEADRAAVAVDERHKGNEAFRWAGGTLLQT